MLDESSVAASRASPGSTGAAAARGPALHPEGRRLALGLAALVALQVVASLLLTPAAENGAADTTLGYARAFLAGDVAQYEDSWRPMAGAVKSWREFPERPIYRRLLSAHHTKIQYPPSSFFLTLAAERLAPKFGLSAYRLLDGVGWLSCWTVIFAAGWLFRRAYEDANGGEPPGTLANAMVLVLALLFYPILRGFWIGQVQSLITACTALALAFWYSGRRATAGVFLGVAALLKPHYALILLFVAWRRRFRAAAAGGIVLAAGSLAGALVFGWRNYVDYLHALQLLAQRGESYYANFSINGLLSRIDGLYDPRHNNADWSFKFPPFVPWVYWGTVASSLVLLAVVFFRRRPAISASAQTADLGVAVLGVTMASPIAWEHHYGVLAPLLAMAAALAWTEPDLRRRRRLGLLLGGAWLLSATYIQPAIRLAQTPWNFLQSYLYVGALAALAALVLLAAERSPATAASAAAVARAAPPG